MVVDSKGTVSDVLIVGGGVIGLTLAWQLAEKGAQVRLIEQNQAGREASWAGAGMLPPADLSVAKNPLTRLRALSHPLWPEWSAQLRSQTGIDNGFVPCGALELCWSEKERAHMAAELDSQGARYLSLSGEDLRTFSPALSPELSHALHLPEMGQVRNPRHLKALVAICKERGVEIIEGKPVTGFKSTAGRITSVQTPLDTFSADRICLTTGAWSRQMGDYLGLSIPVRPVRGQIVLMRTQRLPFTTILQQGEQYLVPRPDGRILIGATMEEAGFVKTNTVSGVASLLQFATRTVPELAQAEVEQTWAGLRPGSPDGIPFLGRAENWDNLFYAFGHFRDGLQLSTGTAKLMSNLLLDQETSLDLTPYGLPSENT